MASVVELQILFGNMNKSYVYTCTHKETGEFYFGYRCANKVPPIEDLGIYYFTSSKHVKPRFHEFKYEILKEFDNKEDAHKFEQQLIIENKGSPKSLNIAYWQTHLVSDCDYKSPERSAKIREAKLRHIATTGYNPMDIEENREKVRLSKLGDKNPMFNNPDATNHLNIKLVCDHCKESTTKYAYIKHHGNGKCNRHFKIQNLKTNETWDTTNIKGWCLLHDISKGTVKYAINVSGKFLKHFIIKEINHG
jgi:hypothetical protein